MNIYLKFEQNDISKIFDNNHFAYQKIQIEHPLQENGKKLKNKNNEFKPDSKLRDYEIIPYDDDINLYFEKELKPFSPDAWVDKSKTKIGYEISFNKEFYKFSPIESVTEINKELENLNEDIEKLMKEI